MTEVRRFTVTLTYQNRQQETIENVTRLSPGETTLFVWFNNHQYVEREGVEGIAYRPQGEDTTQDARIDDDQYFDWR